MFALWIRRATAVVALGSASWLMWTIGRCVAWSAWTVILVPIQLLVLGLFLPFLLTGVIDALRGRGLTLTSAYGQGVVRCLLGGVAASLQLWALCQPALRAGVHQVGAWLDLPVQRQPMQPRIRILDEINAQDRREERR